MTDPIISAPATVHPGDIRFYDRIAPPLKAGGHSISARQEVTGIKTVDGIKEGKPEPFALPQTFDVTAPRFRIPPATIQQVFPPANHQGSFSGVLPSIVLKEFALPWMRTIDPLAKTDDPRPWVGLLTLAGTEMPSEPDSTGARTSLPATIPVSEFVKPGDPTVLPPDLGAVLPADGKEVLATDMDVTFFRQIAPTADDLLYTCHARVVNTDGKVLLGMDEDGAFSVVTGNRMTTDGVENTVLLVSFEGHLKHLPGGDPIPSGIKTIRLAVLGRWSYRAEKVAGGFLQLMEELCLSGRGGLGLLRLDGPPSDPAPDPAAVESLAIGYVPLQNDLRDGEVTTALYRGPLVPQPTAVNSDFGPFYFSDHAIHYDKTNGLFNHAYAAAWQIGRLLALSDAAFVRQLIDWRRAYAKAASDAATARDLTAPVTSALTGNGPAASLPDALRTAFSDRLNRLADRFPTMASRAEQTAPPPAPGRSAEPAQSEADPLAALRRRLRGETP